MSVQISEYFGKKFKKSLKISSFQLENKHFKFYKTKKFLQYFPEDVAGAQEDATGLQDNLEKKNFDLKNKLCPNVTGLNFNFQTYSKTKILSENTNQNWFRMHDPEKSYDSNYLPISLLIR